MIQKKKLLEMTIRLVKFASHKNSEQGKRLGHKKVPLHDDRNCGIGTGKLCLQLWFSYKLEPKVPDKALYYANEIKAYW